MVNEAILVKIKSAQNEFSVPVLFRFMAFVSKYDFHSMDLLYTTLNVDQLLNNYWRLCDPKEPKVVVLIYTKKKEWEYPEIQQCENSDSMLHIHMDIDSSVNEKVVMSNYKL